MALSVVPSGIKDPNADLPAGIFRGRIEKLEQGHIDVKENGVPTGEQWYVLKATIRVVEPAEHKNRIHFETFFIGDRGDASKGYEPDLEAEKPETWQRNCGWVKMMAHAAGVPFEGHPIEEVCDSVRDKMVDFKVTKSISKTNGREYTNVRDWQEAGSMQPAVNETPSGGQMYQPPAQPPQNAPQMTPGMGSGPMSGPPVGNPPQGNPPSGYQPPPFQAPPGR